MSDHPKKRRVGMTPEEWARRIVQRHLRASVELHDDGSSDHLYDLRIGSRECQVAAIEVIRAMDQVATETWQIGPAKGPVFLPLKGDWSVSIGRSCRIQGLSDKLTSLLQNLEDREIYGLYADASLQYSDPQLFRDLKSAGIIDAHCYRIDGTGKVGLSMEGGGGTVDEYGSELPKWLGEFLRHPKQADVLSKLRLSSAGSRQVFVIATLMGTPWPIGSYIFREIRHLPSEAPELPFPVTEAWVVANSGEGGVHLDGFSWRIVDVRGSNGEISSVPTRS